MKLSNQREDKIFFPNLDAFRFFCFLSVFFFHSFHSDFQEIRDQPAYRIVKHGFFGNGNLGVNCFFVLSGFLITFLLIKENERNGRINIPNFWLRRVLRIWPLYFFCVFFGFFIFPLLKHTFGQEPRETAHLAYYLTFTNNFDFIREGLPDASVLGVLWSVAIEEQFYLLWPILLAFLPIRFYPWLFGTIIIGTFVFRARYDNSNMHEYHTFSCIGDMAIGAWGAYLASRDKYRLRMEAWKRPFISFFYALFIVIFFFRHQLLYSSHYVRIFERAFIAAIILVIILEQNYSKHSFFKLSKLGLATKLGVISYGLYCLHFIGILITLTITRRLGINNNLWIVLLVETCVALLITIFISKLSFRYFEQSFLRWKNRVSVTRNLVDTGSDSGEIHP